MVYLRYLTPQERSTILAQRKKGKSIHSLARELHRSRAIITRFCRNPEEYIRNIKGNSNNTSDSYENLTESPTKTIANGGKKLLSASTSTPKNKKLIQKTNSNTKNNIPSDEDLKRFNRVTIEHRAVIKFLIKKGIGPRFIYEDMTKVYGKSAPDLPAILHWAKQYQQGRTTIVNDSSHQFNNSHSTSAKNKVTTPPPPSNNKTFASVKSQKTKLFKFKFKPIKRLQSD